MRECAGKSRKIPAAGKVTSFIPAEVWTEILARLPVKSVLRFRCVSKSFLDTIDDDPNFTAMHVNLNPDNRHKTRLLCCERRRYNNWTLAIRRSDDYSNHVSDQLTLKYNSTSSLYRLCNGVNGLILTMEVNMSRLTLCNPSLRKSLLLPIIPFSLNTAYSCAFLGYIPCLNAYKVVAFQFPNYTSVSNLSIAVYDLVRDGFWRIKTDFMDVPSWWLLKNKHRSVCCDQGSYISWLVQDPNPNPNRSRISCRYTHVVSFDFEKEAFSLMELPENDHDWKMCCFLFPHGRSVGLFGISPMRSYIWVMKKEDGGKECWTKLYSGGSSSDGYGFFTLGSMKIKIAVYMKESDKFFVLKNGLKLISYDIRNYGFNNLSKRRLVNYIDTYMESLVLSKGFEGLTTSFP